MAEELVGALRKRAMDLPEKFSRNAVNIDLLMKAADAIEELSKPKWIPVTERLPKINSDTYSDDLIVCMRRFDGEDYYYEKFAGYLTSGNIWYTYQHDSCSQVGIEQHMKHYRTTADVIVAWMPMPSLPELPKEE